MTNFRLFQTERVCRRQFQIWQKCQKVIQMGRKHCWKKRNCSLRAISPFPPVFSKGLFPRGVKKVSLCGNGLNPLQHNTENDQSKKPFENTKKMLVSSIFSLSYNVFYLSENKFQFLNHIYLDCLQLLYFESGRV